MSVDIFVKVQTSGHYARVTKGNGLIVVDVHSEWCGPCEAIASTFKRIFYESSDKKVTFVQAVADRIEILEKYRGHSQSVFLLYKDGALVERIVGVNLPLITRLIKTLSPPKDDYDDDENNKDNNNDADGVNESMIGKGGKLIQESQAPPEGWRPITPPPGLVDALARGIRRLSPPPGFDTIGDDPEELERERLERERQLALEEERERERLERERQLEEEERERERLEAEAAAKAAEEEKKKPKPPSKPGKGRAVKTK